MQTQIREQKRANRTLGFSASHAELLDGIATYDLTVDTTLQNSEACARAIEGRLLSGHRPTAFVGMRAAVVSKDVIGDPDR